MQKCTTLVVVVQLIDRNYTILKKTVICKTSTILTIKIDMSTEKTFAK